MRLQFIVNFAMAASKMTTAFVQEFTQLLELKGLKANDHLEKLNACLWEHKFPYKAESVHSKYFLTHSANRMGLLISPHNAHRNAARIENVGGG